MSSQNPPAGPPPGYGPPPGGGYPQQGYYQQGPPPKKKHTVRNVLLVLLGLTILFIGGCAVLFGAAVNEVDKAIEEETANDRPKVVEEGAAFEHDGFSFDQGWSVGNEQFLGATIKRLNATLDDDQEVGGRSVLMTFRLYDGTNVVSEITCTSNEMQEGESARVDCSSLDTERPGNYDEIRVADAF